jgi:hypothetical protein
VRLTGGQQVHRGHEVGLHDDLGIALPGVRAVRRQVEHPIRLGVCDATVDCLGLEEVDVGDFDVAGKMVEAPIVAARTDPSDDVVTLLRELLDQVGADEPAGAGDERPHAVQGRRCE